MRVVNSGRRRTTPPPCVPGSSPACPFSTFAASVGSPAGLYWFDVGGSPLELYTEGDGWILIASSLLSVQTGLSAAATPQTISPGDNRLFDQPSLQPIVDVANGVRISEGNGGEEVVSKTSVPITRLRNYQSLTATTGTYAANADWSGNSGRLDASCQGTGGSLPNSIYHACGNTAGLHWIPAMNLARWSHSGGVVGRLNLWVK